MSGFMEYLKGGFQIIYWFFFKPVSFKSRLKIDPIKEKQTLYRLKKTLKIFTQCLLPSVFLASTTTFIVGGIYLIATPNFFNWYLASLVMLTASIFFPLVIALALLLVSGIGLLLGKIIEKVQNQPTNTFFKKVQKGFLGDLHEDIVISTALTLWCITSFGVEAGIAEDLDNAINSPVVWVISMIAMSTAMNMVSNEIFGLISTITLGLMVAIFLNLTTNITNVMPVISLISILIGFRCYFWLPEFFCVIFLRLSSRLTGLPVNLNLLPTEFDEVIILPLPFLESFIAQNYEVYPIATLQKIDYLTNSTNQQILAANSRISIVVNCLNRCKNVTEITLVPDEFNWLPYPLPDEYKFDSSIIELIEIAKDIQSVEKASSPYRTIELSKRPLERLQAVQQNLAFSKSRHRTTLGQITQRWISILKTAQENYQAQAANSFEIPPAYIAGNSLNPTDSAERFKGRLDIFRSIEGISLSNSPPVLLLYGGRRTGKTSSLKYLPNKVDSGLVPLLVDLQGTALSNKLSSFATELAKQIIQFAKDRHNLHIDPPSATQLEDDPFPTLQNWFNDIEKLKPHARFLLCLDEYERLSEVIDATRSKAPLNFLRSTMQNNKRWILLFSGSHTPDELEPYWNDALINAQSIRMSYLRRPEAEELIRHPVSDFPEIYTDAAVERILHWTNCQPYLIQMIGTVLVDSINLEQAEPRNYRITADDVDRVIDKVIERASQYFSELWRNTLTAQQRENLTQFMLDGHLDGIPQNQIRSLIEKEILRKTNGSYEFQVPITEKYLRAQVE